MTGVKLTDKVYLVGGSAYGVSAMGDCNLYLIDCGGKLALIDTGGGAGVSDVLDNITGLGFDPKTLEYALITHCHYDHIGGNKALKEATGCRIAAHESEVDDIENLGEMTLMKMSLNEGREFSAEKVDLSLQGDERIEIGDVEFSVVHTPGHTPGGLCYTMVEDGKVNLFTGDTASADGRLGFINGPGYDHDAWKRSLKKLISLEPDRLFPGHGTFRLAGGVTALQNLDLSWNVPWNVTARG